MGVVCKLIGRSGVVARGATGVVYMGALGTGLKSSVVESVSVVLPNSSRSTSEITLIPERKGHMTHCPTHHTSTLTFASDDVGVVSIRSMKVWSVRVWSGWETEEH